MMTNRQRMLATARGETADIIPYVPRLEIWYNANRYNGTLPPQYRTATMDEIARAEGWALYKVIPEDYDRKRDSDYAVHRALGLYAIPEAPYRLAFPSNITVEPVLDGNCLQVTYHTPVGQVRTRTRFTEEMLRAGTTESWIEEPAIKSPEDYRAVAYIFEHLELVPDFEAHGRWQDAVGEDGLAVTFATAACSPMHHIQKVLIDPTAFFYQYNDHHGEMTILASCLQNFYDQVLDICARAPGPAVHWGENVDSTLTPRPYFIRDILPWLQKATDHLHSKGKVVFSHTDGENQQLMDLIPQTGIDVAESICPYPMTRVPIASYYRQWHDRLTLMGGIPSDMLIAEATSDEQFEAYLDHLFKAAAPGKRIILAVADNVPPAAEFDRLVRIGRLAAEHGRLPLLGGTCQTFFDKAQEVSAEVPAPSDPAVEAVDDEALAVIHRDVFDGDDEHIADHVQQALAKGLCADTVMQQGLVRAMEIVGVRFKNDDMFMPEVLLSARAMNVALELLAPHLDAEAQKSSGRIIIGTVNGDVHDIGKNMVVMMLQSVGFEVRDLGINVAAKDFVAAVQQDRPDILGLSALLSTTMPEMRTVIGALDAAGMRDKVAVMVGGAPVSAAFARQIGADGYAESAGEAVDLAKRLMQSRQTGTISEGL